MPDSFYRVLAAAGVTLLSIVAALVVPASLGALRVAVFGAEEPPPGCSIETLCCMPASRTRTECGVKATALVA